MAERQPRRFITDFAKLPGNITRTIETRFGEKSTRDPSDTPRTFHVANDPNNRAWSQGGPYKESSEYKFRIEKEKKERREERKRKREEKK